MPAILRAEEGPSPSAAAEKGKLAKDPELRDYVHTCLEQGWSPEQISNVLPTGSPVIGK